MSSLSLSLSSDVVIGVLLYCARRRMEIVVGVLNLAPVVVALVVVVVVGVVVLVVGGGGRWSSSPCRRWGWSLE